LPLRASLFYPLYEITKTITGDKAEVINLTQAGIEPHDFEPTAQDIITINSADLLIINGAGFEPWADKISADFNKNGVTIINQAEVLQNSLIQKLQDEETHQTSEQKDNPENKNDHPEHENYSTDPHFWLDPVYYSAEINYLTNQLVTLDPSNASYYKERSQKYQEQIIALHNEYTETLKNCQKKDIVTNHAAFNYLSRRYGFTPINISGISPESEPSAKELAELTKIVKEKKIDYIFTETLLSPKIAETLAKEAGAQTLVLNPLENLTSEEIQQNENYVSIMKKNLANLKIALACK
jgi:zinc transport system substrate-binding protein